MTRLYFVDSENVGDKWLSLLGDPNGKTYVFYTDHTPNMSYSQVINLMNSAVKPEFILCYGGKNGLDFQLVSYIGYELCRDASREMIIVSKDTGYDAVVKFWRDRGMKISRKVYPFPYQNTAARQNSEESRPTTSVESEITTSAESSAAEELAAVGTELPKADSQPTVEEQTSAEPDILAVEEQTSVETEIPAVEEQSGAETEIPAVEEQPTAETEIPTVEEQTSAEPEIPAVEEQTSAETEIPAVEAQPTAETEIPAVEAQASAEEPAGTSASKEENAAAAAAEENAAPAAADTGSSDAVEQLIASMELSADQKKEYATVVNCIGKSNSQFIHTALTHFYGDLRGRAVYKMVKGGQIKVPSVTWKKTTKMRKFIALIITYENRDSLTIPGTVSGFLIKNIVDDKKKMKSRILEAYPKNGEYINRIFEPFYKTLYKINSQ